MHFCLHCMMKPCVCDLVKLELKIDLLSQTLRQPCVPSAVEPPTPPPPTHHQTSTTASLLSTNIFLREDRKRRIQDMDPEVGDKASSSKKIKKKPTYLTGLRRSSRKKMLPETPPHHPSHPLTKLEHELPQHPLNYPPVFTEEPLGLNTTECLQKPPPRSTTSLSAPSQPKQATTPPARPSSRRGGPRPPPQPAPLEGWSRKPAPRPESGGTRPTSEQPEKEEKNLEKAEKESRYAPSASSSPSRTATGGGASAPHSQERPLSSQMSSISSRNKKGQPSSPPSPCPPPTPGPSSTQSLSTWPWSTRCS